MNQLYLLSTGTPTPAKNRFGTCHALALGDERLMIDCGPAATWKLAQAGLFPTQVNTLLFTHHHYDHNADLPCFLLCRWNQSVGAERPLRILGPPPTAWITERLVGEDGAFSHDVSARVNAPISQHVHVNRGGKLPRPAPDYRAEDIDDGAVIRGNGWSASAAQVHHVEPWLTSLAYRVDYEGGSIVFAGDTGPCPSLTRLARGADVLVANCWDHQDTMKANGEADGMAGTVTSGEMARDAGVAKLVLSHTGSSLADAASRDKALADVAAVYDGEVVFAEELMVLSV